MPAMPKVAPKVANDTERRWSRHESLRICRVCGEIFDANHAPQAHHHGTAEHQAMPEDLS